MGFVDLTLIPNTDLQDALLWYSRIGAYVYNQVNNISKCALGHKMCGLGIEMCALGPILACTYRTGPYGVKGAYVYNQ